MFNRKRDVYEFANNYGEKYQVYRRNNPDRVYITGDEMDWKENVLVILGEKIFTAVQGDSFGFWFNKEEIDEIDGYIKRIIYRNAG